MKSRKVNNSSSVMEGLLGTSFSVKQFTTGDVVEGKVVSVGTNEVLVDVGAKSEGIISRDEFGADREFIKNLKPGDPIMALVVQAESDQGYIVLSLRKAERDRKWKDISELYESDKSVEVTVLEYNKGGLLVEYGNLRGFVPLSHLDRVHFTEDMAKFARGSEHEIRQALQILSGKKLKVKVIEFDREKNRLVFSEKKALTEYSDASKKEKLKNIVIGSEMEGIVTGIMPFGIFVDLESVEGLVHISEIAWEKVSHPGSYYSVGSRIKVKVMDIDENSGKLALSVKRLMENPWEKAAQNYAVGQKVKGTVNKIVPFGAFVNLEKGLDGLVHISEATGPLNVGDEVEAVVTLIDAENQKLSLSLKKLDETN